ncbi:MAG TPA: FtsQ-type POTRA domain-containing protein [Candidatus Atribacteria bacterium]|nr:FtsQ-type POTRA domain-containing protein [Candidatus Atribacteria bacterium]
MKIIDENEEEIELEKDDQEEEEEEDQKSQSLGIKIIRILIFYLIIGFIGWNFFNFIFNSKYCNIKDIVIKGNDHLRYEEILYKSQVKLGENIFRLNLNKTIEFLKQEPWIKEIEIKRIIPNKIIISVEERKPSAVIYIDGEYFILDKEGMLLSKIEDPGGLNLPLITGLKIAKVEIGSIIIDPEFRIALEIINSANMILPNKFYKIKILALDDFLILGVVDNLVVRVSKAEEIINKGTLLKEAFEKIIKENLLVDHIDMRFKDSVIIKVKE